MSYNSPDYFADALAASDRELLIELAKATSHLASLENERHILSKLFGKEDPALILAKYSEVHAKVQIASTVQLTLNNAVKATGAGRRYEGVYQLALEGQVFDVERLFDA